uniref:Uncharacterized protein n=1 Tax=Trichogramma kaykai TaxID=54128 RepID=A0ABD2X1B7_9HYME
MGAEVNTMKSTFVLTLGLHVIQKRTILGGFGENDVISPGITHAKIKLGNLSPKEVEFRIVPDNVQRYDLIIGRPFTEALDITYKRVGYDLIFANIDPSLFDDSRTALEKTHSLEDATLPRNTINFVHVKSHAGKMYMPVANFGENSVVKAGENMCERIMSICELPNVKQRFEDIKSEEVITDDCISREQKNEIVEMLNKYRMCVARDINELGCTNALTMDIQIENDKGPVHAKPYKLNAKDRDDLDAIVSEYKRLRIVTETSSEYASPAFLVQKKDGTPRMYVEGSNEFSGRSVTVAQKCRFDNKSKKESFRFKTSRISWIYYW